MSSNPLPNPQTSADVMQNPQLMQNWKSACSCQSVMAQHLEGMSSMFNIRNPNFYEAGCLFSLQCRWISVFRLNAVLALHHSEC